MQGGLCLRQRYGKVDCRSSPLSHRGSDSTECSQGSIGLPTNTGAPTSIIEVSGPIHERRRVSEVFLAPVMITLPVVAFQIGWWILLGRL